MPGVARSGDKGFTGHKCSRIAKVGSRSPSVFANGRLISRKNDPIQTHNILKVVEGKAYCLRHRARVLQGSLNVFVGRKRVACLGHKMDTIKGRIFQSSNNVFANGQSGIPDRGRGRRRGIKGKTKWFFSFGNTPPGIAEDTPGGGEFSKPQPPQDDDDYGLL